MSPDLSDIGFENHKIKRKEQHDIALQHISRAYDYTQKLTFFVIGVQVVICGYILLYSGKLETVPCLAELFALSMLGAITGICWRTLYNSILHLEADLVETTKERAKFYLKLRDFFYWAFVGLTLTLIVSILVLGYYKLRFGSSEESEKYSHKNSQSVQQSIEETNLAREVVMRMLDRILPEADPKPSPETSPVPTSPSLAPESGPVQKQQSIQ